MPIFENDRDRFYQDRLQWTLEQFGYEVRQTSTACHYDFTLRYDGKPHAIVEFKRRDKLWDPLKIDEQKVRSLVGAAELWQVKPILIIESKGMYWFARLRNGYKVEPFLRTKNGKARGETHDMVCLIPKLEFVPLALTP